MDNFGLVLILVLIILIFISAFFSGSETSITAINQIKLDSAAESGQKAAKRVNSLRNKINEVLGVILIVFIGNRFFVFPTLDCKNCNNAYEKY